MHVIFHGLAGGFGGRLEKRPDVHVKSQVGEAGGDHLRPPVVPVLPQLGDQDAGAAAVGFEELI